MNIGIVTFWKSKDNYGQLLQMFALQQYLRNLGHNPFLIRYEEAPPEPASFKWSRIFTYLRKFPEYFKWYLNQIVLKRNQHNYQKAVTNVDRHFDRFINGHIKCFEQVYTRQALLEDPPVADAYICGSDQIWGGDWTYYLDFAPDDKPKIAYAPSLGGVASFKPEYEEKMAELLQRFAFVGMREQSGVEVCHRLGRKDAVKVIDPTLLLSKEDYDKVRIDTKQPGQKPYLFAYILGNPMGCDMKDVYAFAKQKGLEIKYATSGLADDYEHIFPQIGGWVDLIANAEMVVTNSFHGTVFSLIYGTPFVTVLLNKGYERMNTRVMELLKCSGLTDRIYRGNFKNISEEISFTTFNKYKAEEESRTRLILTKLLS